MAKDEKGVELNANDEVRMRFPRGGVMSGKIEAVRPDRRKGGKRSGMVELVGRFYVQMDDFDKPVPGISKLPELAADDYAGARATLDVKPKGTVRVPMAHMDRVKRRA